MKTIRITIKITDLSEPLTIRIADQVSTTAMNSQELCFLDEDITKRQSEIFEMMKEKHKKIVKEAEIEAERVKFAWEEQGSCLLYLLTSCPLH